MAMLDDIDPEVENLQIRIANQAKEIHNLRNGNDALKKDIGKLNGMLEIEKSDVATAYERLESELDAKHKLATELAEVQESRHAAIQYSTKLEEHIKYLEESNHKLSDLLKQDESAATANEMYRPNVWFDRIALQEIAAQMKSLFEIRWAGGPSFNGRVITYNGQPVGEIVEFENENYKIRFLGVDRLTGLDLKGAEVNYTN